MVYAIKGIISVLEEVWGSPVTYDEVRYYIKRKGLPVRRVHRPGCVNPRIEADVEAIREWASGARRAA